MVKILARVGSTKVYWDSELREYEVVALGEKRGDGYFTSDKEDALNTARTISEDRVRNPQSEILENPRTRDIGNHVYDYPTAAKFLGDKGSRKLANNTKVYRVMLRGYYGLVDEIHVRLHNTDIVSYREDGIITLNSGGYQTTTTKQRMNQLLPPGYGISQTKFKWYLRTPEGEVPFVDGMTLTPAGEGFGSRRVPHPIRENPRRRSGAMPAHLQQEAEEVRKKEKRRAIGDTVYTLEHIGRDQWIVKGSGTALGAPTSNYGQALRNFLAVTGRDADINVDVWEERDRLSIILYMGDETVAEWWDDDARQMIEDGFFKSGPRLKHSVIRYAEEMEMI